MKGKGLGVVVAVGAVALAATAWGLVVSIGAGGEALKRVELPEGAGGSLGNSESVVAASWGTASGQLGVSYEGEARGAGSFGIDDRDRVYILDAINRRVLRFSAGSFDRAFELPDDRFEDMVVARDRFAVLSRIEDRRVLVFDDEEGFVATLPIAADVPPLMHVEVVDGEVLVEAPAPDAVAYHAIGRLDGTAYQAAEQVKRRADGRPTPAGTVLVARRNGKNDATVDVLDRSGRLLSRLRAHTPREVAAIVSVMGERDGDVWVAWALHRRRSSDPDDVEGRLLVTKHAPDGELAGSIETGDLYVPEPFRKFALSEAGELYQLVTSDDGIRVVRWAPSP